MKVCLTFGFLGMLRQSNLAPPLVSAFYPNCHTCQGDIVVAPPGNLLIVQWTKMIQVVGRHPVLPIPAIHSHPANPVVTYSHLIASSLTTSPNHPLLNISEGQNYWVVIVMVMMLSSALNLMLDALLLDASLYSLHSICRGQATAA